MKDRPYYLVAFVHGIGEIGGAERELLVYLDRLPGQRVRPLAICPAEGPLSEKMAALGVDVRHTIFPAWRKALKWPQRGAAVRRLRQIFGQTRPTLVHVNDIWWFPQTLRAVRGLGIPVCCHVRQEIHPEKTRLYELSAAHAVFAVSHDVAVALQAGGVQPERIHVLHSGIDLASVPVSLDGLEFRHRYGISKTAPVLGTVANLFPRKGHEVMCRSLAVLRQRWSDIHYLIVGGVGDSDYERMLHALVRSLGLEGQVHFTGFQESVYPALSAMDVYAHPAIMEGFGIALLEAMAMAKPVVATTTGGIPDIVVHEETGMLVAPDDSETLASAVNVLLKDAGRRSLLGQAGRRRVERFFTAETMVSRLVKCYEDVMQAHGAHLGGARA